MKKLHTRKGGFTLIELMIVVAIIGILAAIAIPNFLKFQLKAKTSEGKTNLAAIRTAQESYYSEFGEYVSATASPAGGNIGSAKTSYSATDASTLGFDLLGWSPRDSWLFLSFPLSLRSCLVRCSALGAGAFVTGKYRPQCESRV